MEHTPNAKNPRRAEAGRRNGRFGRGKKSKAGKERSAQNAIKHGLRAIDFHILPHESHEHYFHFRRDLMADLDPRGPRQFALALLIVEYHWLLVRNLELESIGLSVEYFAKEKELRRKRQTIPAEVAAWYAFESLDTRNNTLSNLSRYRTQL